MVTVLLFYSRVSFQSLRDFWDTLIFHSRSAGEVQILLLWGCAAKTIRPYLASRTALSTISKGAGPVSSTAL